MLMIMSSSIIIALLASVMIVLMNLISKTSFKDREKSSPFECGFDPKSNARLPFSLHFFLITVIFLIFDVEITLLFPMIESIKNSNIMIYSMVSISFLFILLIGLLHEWKQGALNWIN
uniref:NADH-ubiquinone oxidoreductase chain 3 n=1 Tax=Tenebrionoidea sp. 13 KM-2017 TaxID=2219468 RepID=A0A346RFQ3_9CUCU|nr:NADH dehydrogenase subunit 3 [Tenebrionoidea sp. 13 KM-2017]